MLRQRLQGKEGTAAATMASVGARVRVRGRGSEAGRLYPSCRCGPLHTGAVELVLASYEGRGPMAQEVENPQVTTQNGEVKAGGLVGCKGLVRAIVRFRVQVRFRSRSR